MLRCKGILYKLFILVLMGISVSIFYFAQMADDILHMSLVQGSDTFNCDLSAQVVYLCIPGNCFYHIQKIYLRIAKLKAG